MYAMQHVLSICINTCAEWYMERKHVLHGCAWFLPVPITGFSMKFLGEWRPFLLMTQQTQSL